MPRVTDLLLVDLSVAVEPIFSPIIPILAIRIPNTTIRAKKEIATRLCIKNHPCKVLTRVRDFISIYAFFFLNFSAKSNSANFVFAVFFIIAFIITKPIIPANVPTSTPPSTSVT